MNQKPQRIVAVSRIKERRGRGGSAAPPRYSAVAARTWKAEGDTKDGATQALREQLANAHRHAATMTVRDARVIGRSASTGDGRAPVPVAAQCRDFPLDQAVTSASWRALRCGRQRV